MVRVRFAPSPTGPLHIGGVRTCLYNYLFAKKQNGKLLLRIEDTDQTRFVPGAEEYIIEAFDWLGIQFDEGVHVGGPHAPYKQSERMELYREFADLLIRRGWAYYAFDTPQELEQRRKEAEAQKSTFQKNLRFHISSVGRNKLYPKSQLSDLCPGFDACVRSGAITSETIPSPVYQKRA